MDLREPGCQRLEVAEFGQRSQLSLDILDRLRLARGLRGPGRTCGTTVSGWEQQLVSQIGVADHALP